MKIRVQSKKLDEIKSLNDACKYASIIYDYSPITIKEALDIAESLISTIYGFYVSNTISPKNAVKLYIKLFLIEDFMQSSIIKNTKLSDNFLFIKENLRFYESVNYVLITS